MCWSYRWYIVGRVGEVDLIESFGSCTLGNVATGVGSGVGTCVGTRDGSGVGRAGETGVGGVIAF